MTSIGDLSQELEKQTYAHSFLREVVGDTIISMNKYAYWVHVTAKNGSTEYGVWFWQGGHAARITAQQKIEYVRNALALDPEFFLRHTPEIAGELACYSVYLD